MSTDTQTRSETQLGSGNPEEVAHYLRKDKHAAYVTGKEVTALCGYKWIPHRDPEKLPICETCKSLLDALKSM